ncbi:hypothetical protein Ddc_10967 [Ditylenchus destructor]|nr:hypothetical protein Ddc_10967 [Ditylenchus destructor]
MGPRMPENGNHNAPHGSGTHSSSEDEIDVPEEDGWRIGYEVHMEGLGVVNVYDGGMNSDASDFSTDDEGDIGSEDNSDNEAKRAGYRPLLADASPAAPNTINNELASVGGPSASDVDQASVVQAKTPPSLNMPPPPPLPEDLKIPHKPMPIALNEESISQIKSAMSKMEIPTPPWAADLEDNKLSELVQELKRKI